MRYLPAAVAVAVLAAAQPGGAGGVKPGTIARTERVARHSPCGTVGGKLRYGYPVRPFHRQHPIRGAFGDPRTLSGESLFGADTPATPGSYTFHNGVDISAPTGTPVYPVVSGTAEIGYGDEVIVATDDGRHFQYFHVRPSVRPGTRVIAYRTVIGHVLPHWLHVHLSEIDGFRIHNPADPGHLTPYRDRTVPTIDAIEVSDDKGHEVSDTTWKGRVLVAAQAQDLPPLPVPGVWFGYPVVPALVAWHLETDSGAVAAPGRVVADFRKTEPPNRDFWRVYAAGTYQNFPVFGRRYFYRRPGRYLFALTRDPLDTRLFRNGTYVVVVRVADVCGNVGTFREWVEIRN